MTGYVATAEIEVRATPTEVWAGLTDPEKVKQYMFGAQVRTDWQVGSPIVWAGEYQGTAYEDKGEVLRAEPGRLLEVTHFSPLTGQPDVPENYHTLTYELADRGTGTHVRLSQDNNASEAEAEHSRGMWEMFLCGMKEVVERDAGSSS